MHLLAHALCGGTDDQLVVGQVAGDYVRGRDLTGYPERIADGIRQHRQLDSFTDQHAAVRRSRARLTGDWRRYAGVLVDLAFGHALAQQWAEYGTGDLLGFDEHVHAVLGVHHAVLPARLQNTRTRLQHYRVLSGIGDADGVELACDRLSHRLPGLAGGHTVIAREQEGLLMDFAEFWPALATKTRELNQGLLKGGRSG